MTEYVPVLVALVAGPVAAIVTARLSQPKVRADATKTLTDISLSLVEPQRQRIADCERRMARIERWAHALAAQVIEAGKTPIRWEDVE